MTDDVEKARRIAENWHLGQTSASHESGPAGAGQISTGKGDHGGVSYGSYQFSTKMGTLQEYLDQSKYGPQFKGLEPATPAFDAKWRELAKDPAFGKEQHDFVGRSHYGEQDAALKKMGIDLSGRGMAVQDALWSTSVQFRGLTPGIFDKGMEEKFGKNYEVSKLSDKDIVDAVQDYKINHNASLFKSSPEWQPNLKKRAEKEKTELENLADADRVLKDNGIKVDHKAPPAGSPDKHTTSPDKHTSAPHTQGDHVQRPGTLREHDHSPKVKELQEQLARLGYKGADGKALHPDSDFGKNTRFALESFQKDHHLTKDGIAGTKTFDALHKADVHAHKGLGDAGHPGHAMYEQALKGVSDLDAKLGRKPDQHSSNLAGAIATAAHKNGLTRVDHVVFDDKHQHAYAVQGDLNSPLKKMAEVDVAQAAGKPLEQSGKEWQGQPQPAQQQAAQQQQQQQQQQPAHPAQR